MTRYCVLLSIAWLVSAAPALANITLGAMQCVETGATINGSQLLPHMYHYRDVTGTIKTPNLNTGYELSRTAQSFPFVRLANPGEEAVLGKNQTNHWFRFCLHNTTKQPLNLVVAFEPPTLSEIDFYPQKRGLPSFKTGNTKKMSTRDIPNSQFDFNARLFPDERQIFYVRISTDRFPFLSVNLWDRVSYEIDNNKNQMGFGVFVGVLMGLVLYNMLLFASARQPISLIYVGWSLSVFVLLASVNGLLVQYLTPDHPKLGIITTAIFSPISIYLFAFLCGEFIQIKNYPKWHRVGRAFLLISLLPIVGFYFYDPTVSSSISIVFAVFVFVYYSLTVPIYTLIKDRLVAAKYVLIIQAPLIVFIVDRGLFNLGATTGYYIPYKLTTAIMPVMILISYYIGLMTHREKEAAQRSALEQLNISNTLKSNYNTQLEAELEQKTADIRSMNSDLEQHAKKLLQLDQSKSNFFANISHEFRTPLTLIEGPLTMLLEREGFPEKQTIEGVIRNSNSLKRLIDQILLLSELDEKSLDLKASKVNIVQAVNEFAAQFVSSFEQKGIRLSFNVERPVIQAYVDYEKLQIIVNNLLSNAIKFSQRSDQVIVDISSTARGEDNDEYTRDEYVQIMVNDTGQGIPDNEQAYVFDRYFQSDSSELSKSGLGTGIGLALVKELVELHAGEVTVESVYQQENSNKPSGTSFCVTLPLGRAHLRDNEVVQEIVQEIVQDLGSKTEHDQVLVPSASSHDDGPEPTDKSSSKQVTVLVVDDNEDMRRHIRRLLKDDYKVVTANDGLLAEKALNEHLPNLIITDLMMPNRNGLEFVESIKKNKTFVNIPVIMLTARAGLENRIKGLMAAVDDYLVKPFNSRELTVRIKNLLDKQAQFNAFYQNQSSEPENQLSKQTEAYIDKVKAVVNQRLMEPDFGVEELAQALHVSEATLRRRLSDKANFTPAAFIRHCRLEQARHLSLQGNMRSIAELSNAVGFSQPSYFSRLYQRTFNCQIDIQNKPEQF